MKCTQDMDTFTITEGLQEINVEHIQGVGYNYVRVTSSDDYCVIIPAHMVEAVCAALRRKKFEGPSVSAT